MSNIPPPPFFVDKHAGDISHVIHTNSLYRSPSPGCWLTFLCIFDDSSNTIVCWSCSLLRTHSSPVRMTRPYGMMNQFACRLLFTVEGSCFLSNRGTTLKPGRISQMATFNDLFFVGMNEWMCIWTKFELKKYIKLGILYTIRNNKKNIRINEFKFNVIMFLYLV